MDSVQDDSQEDTATACDGTEGENQTTVSETPHLVTAISTSKDSPQSPTVTPIIAHSSLTLDQEINITIVSPSKPITTNDQVACVITKGCSFGEQIMETRKIEEVGQIALPPTPKDSNGAEDTTNQETPPPLDCEDTHMVEIPTEAVEDASGQHDVPMGRVEEGGDDGKDNNDANNNEEVDEGECICDKSWLVENPSQDIRGDLAAALDGSMEFKGSLSFHKAYAEAPNPVLRLDGLGVLGLPLSEKDAKIVISHCERAPVGKGEQTIVDASVRDSWEIDSSKVHFDNPAWQTFMDRIVKEVCQTFGAGVSVSRPRAELDKLLLYEKGSHFLPPQDTEKIDGMFATITVVLPSHFTGGAAHISHGAFSAVLHSSLSSNFQTTVMAWYADMVHEIKPITSGYRLALSFNLIHPPDAPRPPLPTSHIILSKLRHILLSWKQGDESTPIKIIILLGHEYTGANLCGSALKGYDAHIVGLLNPLAKELGFQLCLANLECYQKGNAKVEDEDEDDSYYRRRRRRYDGYGYGGYDGYDDDDEEDEDEDKEEVDDDDVEMDEVDEEEVTIEGVVDLRGTAVMKSTECDDDDEMIPSTLRAQISSGYPDEQKNERYERGFARSVERWFRHTVLLIWPNINSFEVEGIHGFLRILGQASGSQPTDDEQLMLQSVFRAVERSECSKKVAVGTLCRLAFLWSDVKLWQKAVWACDAWGSVAGLGVKGVLKAMSHFGFEPIRSTIEGILAREPNNIERQNFVASLNQWILEHNQNDLVPWLGEQQSLVVQSLRPPMMHEVPFFLDLARLYGGFSFLVSTIIPQVKEIADPSFLLAFAWHIHNEAGTITQTDDDKLALSSVVTGLLSISNAKIDFFAPAAVLQDPALPTPTPTKVTVTPEVALIHLKMCFSTGNSALAPAIIEKLTVTAGIPSVTAQSRAKHVLLPLIPKLNQIRSNLLPPDTPFPDLKKFCKITVALYMDQLGQSTPTKQEWDDIMVALLLGQGTDLLEKTILFKLGVLPWNEEFHRELIKRLQMQQSDLIDAGVSPTFLAIITSELVKRIIQRVGLFEIPYRLVDLLKLCFDTKNSVLASDLFARLVNSSQSKENVRDSLVPLLGELSKFCRTRSVPITSEPFASTCKWIVKAWVSKVLGPKPPDASELIDTAKRIACSCDPCAQVVRFLTQSLDQRLSLHGIGVAKGKHVERQLHIFARGAATWKNVGKRPLGLEVNKVALLLTSQQWHSEHRRGTSILASISTDDQVLRSILGRDYPTIYELITGKRAPISGLTSASTQTGASSTGKPALSTVGPSSTPPQALTVHPPGYLPPPAGPTLSSTAAMANAPIAHTTTASLSATHKRKRVEYIDISD